MSRTLSESNREIIQRLLAAAGSNAPAAGQAPQDEAVDYDWTSPARFVRAQLAKLEELAAGAASEISQALSRLLGGKLEFVPAGLTQQFAVALREASAEANEYWVTLTRDGEPCGLIALSGENAIGWVCRLLGGADAAAAPDRELSALESALLLDVVAALAEALSRAVGAGPAFTRGETVARGRYSLPGDDAAEYCKVALAPAEAQENPSVALVVASDVLESVVGGASQTAHRSPEDIRRDLLAALQAVPVPATAWLGQADIPMRELVALEPEGPR